MKKTTSISASEDILLIGSCASHKFFKCKMWQNYITSSKHKIYFPETHLDRALAWISCERHACNKYLQEVNSLFTLCDVVQWRLALKKEIHMQIHIWNFFYVKCSFSQEIQVRHNWLHDTVQYQIKNTHLFKWQEFVFFISVTDEKKTIKF